MKATLCSLQILLFIISSLYAQPARYQNEWKTAPQHIPNEASVDAPLMGNGDITMSLGFEQGLLRYYLSKNDFWRLQSKADHRSGPRVAGYADLKIAGFDQAAFTASQSLANGKTTSIITTKTGSLRAESWISATDNLIFISLSAVRAAVDITIGLSAPENKMAKLQTGESNGIRHLSRSFTDSVDIPSTVAIALRILDQPSNKITLIPGQPITLVIAMESKFKKANPLNAVLKKAAGIHLQMIKPLWQQHLQWWDKYWQQSSVKIADTILMKAYYQGLYTMAACSRDKKFPPAIFGWCTTDHPTWNGDYHLNYNFYAPFYGLYAANRIEQSDVQEAPLLDFMPRGKWYASHVTKTRGILYPVGIGPLGVDLTRDFPIEADNGYTLKRDVEFGGLFYQQKSNAVFGTVNMAQHWRHTYDLNYAKKIYPYVISIADFWEDFLKFERGRYVIYEDAQNEKSGYNKNPTVSLALLRNALQLAIELSTALKKDQQRQLKWKDILARLSDYPTEMRNGKRYFRGAEEDQYGKPVSGISSSLIYPSNGIGPDSGADLLQTGWNSVNAGQRWQHHNSTNSFYMSAIRVGYDAGTIFNELHKYALHTYPNGFQLDNPHGIENSCTVANALDEMFCMSVGYKIRLFSVWPMDTDAEFDKIRTWGAFLVSARLSKGTVSDLKVFSEKGQPCTLLNPWKNKTVVLSRNGIKSQEIKGTELRFQTAVNELIELKPL